MKTKGITINTKMIIYGLIMSVSVLLEVFLRGMTGVAGNIAYYGITITRLILCIYMTFAFGNEARKGHDYKACKKSFRFLSYVFAIDLIFNLIFLTYYNGHQTKEMLKTIYLFFAIITILEFVLSSFGYLKMFPERSDDQGFSLSKGIWELLNVGIIVVFIMLVMKLLAHDYSIHYENWLWVFVILLLVREPVKYYISSHCSRA